MEYTDYYAVLGVPRDASQDAVKKSYRALARKLHPDVNQDPTSEARFKRVNEAYEVLKDPAKRAKYDQLGANWEELERQEEFARSFRSQRRGSGGAAGASFGGSGFSDFFETFFGSGGVDLDELLRQGGRSGSAVHFSFGDGATATATAQRRARPLQHDVEISLEEAAQGAHRLLQIGSRQVEVRIPAGVAEGSTVRVGDDVHLTVRLQPHPRFTVRGRDLLAELPVRDDQAVLGGSATVRTLAGAELTVTVPPSSQSGRTLRLRGKGLPGLRGAAAGDLLLTVRITVPSQPGDEEREAYRRLQAIRDGVPAAATPAPPPG